MSKYNFSAFATGLNADKVPSMWVEGNTVHFRVFGKEFTEEDWFGAMELYELNTISLLLTDSYVFGEGYKPIHLKNGLTFCMVYNAHAYVEGRFTNNDVETLELTEFVKFLPSNSRDVLFDIINKYIREGIEREVD